jgi:hypothetical protein
MKASFKHLLGLPMLLAGLGLIPAGRVVAGINLSVAGRGSQAVLSWSNSSTYYDLQWRTNLASDSWNTAANNIAWVGNRYYATNPIVAASRFFRLASRDAFTNAYTQLFEYDPDIENGVAIQKNSRSFTVAQQDSTNFLISFPGTNLDLPVVLSDDTLRNTTRPIVFPSFNVPDVLLLSDGVNKVFTYIGRDESDNTNASLNLACWTEAKGSLAASDLAGTWVLSGYSIPNLRDTSSGFSPQQLITTITAIGTNKISISSSKLPGAATISGMEATWDNVPLNTGAGILQTLKITSNGLGLSMYFVVTELNDPTDVSVTVLLGTKL